MSARPNLARPDVFHPSIVLAGCPQLVAGDGDDDGLIAALRTRGLHARWLSWDDPQAETADLVILRAAWDYAERRDEFLAWTRRVRHLLNAPGVVAWNSDKHYLQDLADAGVPTVPSFFFGPGDKVRLPKGEVVVKPAIGAGSIDTGRFVDRAAARAHVAALQDSGRTALVQPYDARVEQGETALVFLGGRQSHAFTKGPMLPPEGESPTLHESGTYVEESLAPADPDFEMWDVGVAALAAASRHLGIETSELLYARVDLIGGADDPLVLELEVIEPSLGWRQLDERTRDLQQRAFAIEVESACERLGLGPLSHRRP
ncbi:ATP-grasp domain-containing protein [Mycolicibacterium psychrotolerans]|uniref:ATP-grasp domain-containing protein n=1 Tax=Mycolicibacterium psychrotolerans TaxID=216929 RepID=UPI003D66D9E5